jgi:hypothetical protein
MAVNQYFNQTTFISEQNLVEDLVIESIQIHGQDFYYIERTEVNADTIFNEASLSEFNTAHLIEMHIEDSEGFGGEGDFLSKFGLEVRDQLNVIVSKKRFAEATNKPLPLSGDLIYFPLVDRCFEIQFVEDEIPFYQLGKMYVFRLATELFEYSHESFDTGVAEIDDIGSEITSFSVDLTFGSGTGDFAVGETIYQGSALADAVATGEVISWNSGTKVLRVGSLTGTFSQNTNTVGSTSSAEYLLGATQQITYIETTDNATDNSSDFSGTTDSVIDFSVTNPFSESY